MNVALSCVLILVCTVGAVVAGLLRDPGFDATWKLKNYSEAQRSWHPFVNGFHPSTNPKLAGVASLGVSSTWPAGTFQYVPGPNLPPYVREYTFSVWTLVDSIRPVPADGLGNVTIDVAYAGGADSFTATIASTTSRPTYRHGLAEEENEQGWAAQRHTVWKEEWQHHCFTFALDEAEQVESLTVFLISSHHRHSSDTVQLWVDQADLFSAQDYPPVGHTNCTQLMAVTQLHSSMSDRYQLHIATCTADYAASSSDVTLVTHLSLDQLPMLNELAASWKGPISAAVLVPDRLSLGDLIKGHKFDRVLKEWTTLHAVYLNQGKDRPNSYPSGFLRRAATEAAVTTHVLHVDINYLPANCLRDDVEKLVGASEETVKMVYVVPSFAPRWDMVDAPMIPINKKALLDHLRQGRVYQVRGSKYDEFDKEDDERAVIPVPRSELHAPFVVVPKELSTFDDMLEGKCGMELDALKILLDLRGYSFVYLPSGYVLRMTAEPSLHSCSSRHLGEWRAWYSWLLSTTFEHEVSPTTYYHCPLGEPYARGRGITGVVSLMLDREPLFGWLFLGSCGLTMLVVLARKFRERQRDLSWGLPTHKGE